MTTTRSKADAVDTLAAVVAKASNGFHRLLDAAMEMLTRTETTLAEFISSTTLIYVGVVLALPEQGLVAGSGLYTAMRRLMPEGWWAVVFLAAGLFQSFANLYRSQFLRRMAASVAAAVFAYIGFLGIRVSPVSLFGAMCKAHALGQVIVWLHLGHRIRSRAQGAR